MGELLTLCKEHRLSCLKCGDVVRLPVRRESASEPVKAKEAA